MNSAQSQPQFHKTLGPLMLWGLGVGYVISGMYFGWNLGLPAGGPYGVLAAAVITISVFGALVLYIVAMIALLRLRATEPDLQRPYRTPFYPVPPIVALAIAVVCLLAMTVYNLWLAGVFIALVGAGYAWFYVASKSNWLRASHD